MTRRGLGLGIVGLGAAVALCLACGGKGAGGGVVDEISVGLTTQGGANTVAPGGTLGILANVNNASNPEVTWSLSGATCPAACGTIAQTATRYAVYTAPASVTAPFTVTVTATSVQNTARSGAVTLTVQRSCPASAALLSGPYAFLLQGFTPDLLVAAALGSFTADGCGLVTGGEVDYQLGASVAGHEALSGTYSVGDDGRGRLDLVVAGATRTFALSLGKRAGAVATRGGMTELDPPGPGVGVLTGEVRRQDAASFAPGGVSGPYAFVLSGWSGALLREAVGGTVEADGAGHLGSGLLDGIVFEPAGGAVPVTGVAWTATCAAPSATTGRSVLAAPAFGGASAKVVMYVVDAGRTFVLVSDPTAGMGRVLGGAMIAQTGGPYGLGSLHGRLLTQQTGAHQSGSLAVLAFADADGQGSLDLAADVNGGGNVGQATGHYTYTVTAPGAATMLAEGVVDGGRWYLTAPNTALMLGFDYGVSVGEILPQAAGPFSTASIDGSYAGAQLPGASFASTIASGVASSPGDGQLLTVMDENGLTQDGALHWAHGEPSSVTVDASGRGVESLQHVLYLVSPDRFLRMSTSSQAPYPVIHDFER